MHAAVAATAAASPGAAGSAASTSAVEFASREDDLKRIRLQRQIAAPGLQDPIEQITSDSDTVPGELGVLKGAGETAAFEVAVPNMRGYD